MTATRVTEHETHGEPGIPHNVLFAGRDRSFADLFGQEGAIDMFNIVDGDVHETEASPTDAIVAALMPEMAESKDGEIAAQVAETPEHDQVESVAQPEVAMEDSEDAKEKRLDEASDRLAATKIDILAHVFGILHETLAPGDATLPDLLAIVKGYLEWLSDETSLTEIETLLRERYTLEGLEAAAEADQTSDDEATEVEETDVAENE